MAKIRPAPRRPGNSCTWSVMRAPAESTSQKMGRSWARAYSAMRIIFSTVRAPHEPAFTVGSLATTQTGRPSMVPVPVTTPSAGRSSALVVGQQGLLDERAGVEQQRQPVADEELALLLELGRVGLEVAGQGPLGRAGDGLRSGRVRSCTPRSCLRRGTGRTVRPDEPGRSGAADGEDGGVVGDRLGGEVLGRLEQRLAQHVGRRRRGRGAACWRCAPRRRTGRRRGPRPDRRCRAAPGRRGRGRSPSSGSVALGSSISSGPVARSGRTSLACHSQPAG